MSSADAPFRRRADDHAAGGGRDLLEDVLQPLPLGVLQPARDAETFAVRDVDEESAGQRDLRRQPRALRLHRVLDGLDEDLLSALDQVGDLLAVTLPLELGDDDLVDVEEPVPLEADLDERALHPRQHVVDRAQVDVAGDRAALRALEVDLGDPIVLEERDALLADVDRDQELALRLRQGRPAGRLPPPLLTPAAAPLRRPLPRPALGPSVLLRRGCRSRGAGGSSVASDVSFGWPGFLRPRPPRLPRRRRLRGAVPSAAGVSSFSASCCSGGLVLPPGRRPASPRARPCVVETGTRARIVSPRVTARVRTPQERSASRSVGCRNQRP